MAATCPFKHLWAAEPAASTAASDLAVPAETPEPNVPEDPLDIGVHKNSDAKDSSASQRGCPVGFGRSAQEAPQGQCPLGFGSARGPKMSALHCILCKSLLFDATMTNCGHTYCQVCISRFVDCPTCGADIEKLIPDADAQNTVDAFLKAHAGVDLEGQGDDEERTFSLLSLDDLDPIKHNNAGEPATRNSRLKVSTGSELLRKAHFFLQLGLRSFAGGNPEAAAHRIQECATYLLQAGAMVAKSREEEAMQPSLPRPQEARTGQRETEVATEASVRLGPVYECLGDVRRACGDAPGALEAYNNALQYVESCEDPDPTRLAQPLAVTLNKTGEVLHEQGDVARALDKYMKALELRKLRWAKRETPSVANFSAYAAGMDVIVSELKVADAYRTLGQIKEASQHASAARRLLKDLDGTHPGGDSAHSLERKRELIEIHLNSFE